MAVPATPTNVYVQTANGQVYVSCDLTATATSYVIQRSADGVTYSTPTGGTGSIPGILDTTPVLGTQYWYKMAAVNSDGTSTYSAAQTVVAVPAGEMSLGQIRLNAQRRADQVNSSFLSVPEWNENINQSLFELYNLLVGAYEDQFVADPIRFSTNGTSQKFPLPDGATSYTNGYSGSTAVAPAFFKLLGLDLGVNNGANGWISLKKFNFADRNKYFFPNSNSGIYGIANMNYRILGNNLLFTPIPSSNLTVQVWYAPRMTMLLRDNDYTTSGVSGYIEYVICDAAIKAMQKEESDISGLLAIKAGIKKELEEIAQNRDLGQPDTISDVRGDSGWSSPFGWGGPSGGL